MPREKADYRANLEMLQGMFPGKASISIEEAAQCVGMKAENYRADKTWPRFPKGKQERVALGSLAQRISSL